MDILRSRHSEYSQIPESDHYHQELNHSQENLTTKIYGLKISYVKAFFYYFFSVLLLGLPCIIVSWYPQLGVVFKYKSCSLSGATKLLICDIYSKCIVNIEEEQLKIPKLGQSTINLRYFIYQHTKYVWHSDQNQFVQIDQLIPPTPIDEHLVNVEGLYHDEYENLLKLYGPNKISVEVKSYWKLFVDEVFNPFYLFQVFSVTLWTFDDYYIYAGCVVVLTLFSVITTLLQTRRQSEALHDLVESSKCHSVKIIREKNKIQEVDAEDLVPGDLILLPKADFILPCDCLLLNGQCIVNESMLTGESVPVTKTAPHSTSDYYSPEHHKRYTLFCGTHLIQSRYYGGENILARVVRTGFNTTKGALVKSILFPTPVNLKFYEDSLKFVFVLFIIAAFGTGYCLYLYLIRNSEISEIVIRSLDIVTIVVPPALPAAMTVGIVYSQNRLKKKKIFCISPPRINVCGKIKLACFDKTGTLTHDGLDMHSVVPCEDKLLLEPIFNKNNLHINSKLVQGMATCHSLTRIGGKINGDPLDLSMFEFTNWLLDEPGEDETTRYDMLAPTVVMPPKKTLNIEIDQIGIIRQFPFSSTLQSMSVICRNLNLNHMEVFTKGAPEKVAMLCKTASIPSNFHYQLSEYAIKGYRVLAVAYKELPVKFKWKDAQKVKRELIECELKFLGLLVLQNPLKDETAPVIRTLHNANIRTVMITGDNILTAISVARDCGMVEPNDQVFVIDTEDIQQRPQIILQSIGCTTSINNGNVAINIDLSHCHFAIDGRNWTKLNEYYPEIIPKILVRTVVFARFQPDQKTQLIRCFQNIDYIVSMVGDGANDCGALKAAHVGVSLSQAEASVAAPFTSSTSNISCIVHLILEGRCALVTSFAVFKYMALYSLIQFFTILLLYQKHSSLGDMQFLYIDLILTTVLAVTIGHQGPAKKLGKKRPMGSLVSPLNLIPMILQIFFCGFIQLASIYYLTMQKWYKPIPSNVKEEVIICWEDTVLFTVSSFQYIILAFVYSKGRPYRQIVLKNTWFIISALTLTIFTIYLTILPSKMFADFFEIIPIHETKSYEQLFRYKILIFPLLHLFIAIFIENGLADRNYFKKINNILRRKKLPKNQYKRILLENKNIFDIFSGNSECNSSFIINP